MQWNVQSSLIPVLQYLRTNNTVPRQNIAVGDCLVFSAKAAKVPVTQQPTALWQEKNATR
jgi:hypothetical protein